MSEADNEKERKARQFFLFVDTNAVWTEENKLELFRTDFIEKWKVISSDGDIALVVPRVVFEEIASQKYRTLYKGYSAAFKEMERVESLVFGTAQVQNSKEKIEFKNRILKILEEKIKEIPHCILAETPYIDAGRLKQIIDSAIWRHAPFKGDKDGSGFRDAIILEVLYDLHLKMLHSDFAFISKDERLVQAAQNLFRKSKNFGVFSDLEEFSNYLNVARSKFTPEFLHETIARAHTAFGRLVPEHGIEQSLIEKFRLKTGEYGFDRSEPRTGGLSMGFLGYAGTAYECLSEPRFAAGRTIFISVVGKNNKFHLVTPVFINADYGKTRSILFDEGGRPVKERNIIVGIEWEAIVDDDFTFTELEVLQINTVEDEFKSIEDVDIDNLQATADLPHPS